MKSGNFRHFIRKIYIAIDKNNYLCYTLGSKIAFVAPLCGRMEKCQMTIGFIGAGHMASSLISGIVSSGDFRKKDIYIYDVKEDVRQKYLDEGFNVVASEAELVLTSNIVFLCIRQPELPAVLSAVRSVITSKNVIVSVVAGISIGFIKAVIGQECKVIRSMPNMPASVCKGATAISYDMPITYAELNKVKEIFETIGIVEILPEEQMNEVISVSSSSPAYVYMLMRAMVEGGVQQGMDKDTAETLVYETVAGSVEYAKSCGKSLDEIIASICSPNGTTIRAVDYLEKKGFEQAVKDAMLVCTKRAYMLEKEI